MLNPREYQTPNALDPGEAPPSRPSRRVPEPGDTLPSASSSFPAQKLPSAFQDSNYDNESYTVHDQLPSVEEARMYSARILQQNSQRDLGAGSTEAERARLTDSIPLNPLMRDVREQRKRRFVRLCCGLVGALAVVMVIVFVAVEAKSPSPSPAAPQTVASPPTPPPHVTDDPPTPQPTGISPRLQQALQFLSANSISNPESFLDKATPQYEAAAWMADQDLLKYEIPSSVQDQSTRFVQRYALVVFYLTMEGPRWRNQLQFLDKTDECSWFRTETLTDGTSVAVGVTCTENEEVENILMPRNQLKGHLPSELALLTALDFFDLNRNEVEGTIPDELFLLKKLDFFDIRFNNVTGTLPDWIGEAWHELVLLGFSSNGFTGEIPASYGSLSVLKTLALDDNNLIGGLSTLNTMTNLEFVHLDQNNFKHPLDDQFLANCNKLQQLDLSGNDLTGNLPQHFFKYTNLQVLDLGDNAISGPIPQDVPANTVMTYLSLVENGLSGPIPATLDQLQGLRHLDLTGNLLNGGIPESLDSLSKLTYLFLGDNDFDQGPVPSWLVSTKQLRELSLADTSRTGSIPPWIPTLNQLVLLDLSGNSMDGEIPDFLWSLTSLAYLLLQNNKFNGQLPAGISKLSQLDLLVLDKNDLVGNVDEVCTTLTPRFVIADCQAVKCTCCTGCCTDGDVPNSGGNSTSCSDEKLYATLDGSWEHDYKRTTYTFSPDILFDAN